MVFPSFRCKCPPHCPWLPLGREVLATNHIDENTVDTIAGKVEVVDVEEYKRRGFPVLPSSPEEEEGVAEPPIGTVFFVRTFYDMLTKLQRPIFCTLVQLLPHVHRNTYRVMFWLAALDMEDDGSKTVENQQHGGGPAAEEAKDQDETDDSEAMKIDARDNLQEAMAHLEVSIPVSQCHLPTAPPSTCAAAVCYA